MVEQMHTAGWWPGIYEPLRGFGRKVADWIAPRSDASTDEDFYEINIELPGVKPGDVDVSVHDGSVMIKGEKHFEREKKGRTFFFSEREYGSFQRTFRLPADADAGKIDAEFGNGVLCLKIARAVQKQSEGRKIDVRSA